MSASSDTVVSQRVRLPASVALHARPAGLLVREAARLAASVTVSANGKSADARSILDILALGAEGGTELSIAASGDGAAEAVERLVALVADLA